MKLTRQTDIALRALLYLAAHEGESVTIDQLCAGFNLPRNHVTKVIARLAQLGYIEARRGRQGGLALGRPAHRITVAEVVRHIEPGFDLLECFHPETSTCPVTGACALESALRMAAEAFLRSLMDHTIADALGAPGHLKRQLERVRP